MVDKTLEAFGMTVEEMKEANQQAAEQMLPVPYDIPGEVGPIREDRFGDTAAWAAKDSWEEAKARFQSRGTKEGVAGAIPEADSSVLNTFAAGLGYAADMGLSGLAASDAAWRYSVGLASELIPGMDKSQEQRFTRDVSSIPEAFAGSVTGVVGGIDRLPDVRQATTGARMAAEDVLDAMPPYDPNTVSSFGVRGERALSLGGRDGPEFEGLPPLRDERLKEWPEQVFLAHEPEHFSMLNLPEEDIATIANAYESYLVSSSPEAVKALGDSLDSQVAMIVSEGKNPLDPEYLNTLVRNASKEKDLALEKLEMQMMGDALVEGAFMETVGPLIDERIAVMDPKGNLRSLELGEWAWVENKVKENLRGQSTPLGANAPETPIIVPARNANLDNWSENAYFKDAEGGPQQLYHGMSGNLRGQPVEFSGENLEPSYMGTLGPGTYLTRDPSVASDFATGKRGGYTDEKFGGQVIPVYTNVTKVVDDDVINSNKELRTEIADLIEENTDDNYLFNLADKLRGEGDINLSSLFTRTEDGKVRSTGVGSLVSSLLESKGYEGISVVTDKGFHEAVIFPGHGGVEFPRQNIKSSLQGPEGQYSRETNDMRFAEGGLAMERQMNTMMAEGGIKDSGMNRDPISGNEIPAGSLAKEVRDDVDAKLSEGEYVVPADVVRYFGVNYFEKLRQKAKSGLEEMDKDGRIGGDPVDEQMGSMMDDGLPFSDEELMSTDDGEPIEMAEGGDVAAGARSAFNPMAFQPGFSFGMGGGSGQGLPSETKTFVNAQGEVRSILFINGQPIQQIPSGFVEDTPENRAKFTEGQTTVTPTSESSRDRDRDNNRGVQLPQSSSGERPDSLMSEEDVALLSEDPLAFGKAALEGNRFLNSKTLGTIGSLINPALGVLGGSAGTYMEMQNIADARAAKKLMEDRGLTDTEDYRIFVSDLKAREDKMSMAAKGADAFLDFSGDRLFEQAKGLSTAPIAPMTPQAIPTGPGPSGSTRSTTGAGITYDTTVSTSRDRDSGRESTTERSTIAPGTSAAPTTSIRPVARPDRESSADKRREKESKEAISRAQSAADRLGTTLAKGGRATGGLVQRPKKKTVAKK